MKQLDLTNAKYGRLTVLYRTNPDSTNRHDRQKWMCRCDCGRMKSIHSNNMRSGKTKSCGCLCIETSVKAAAAKNTKHSQCVGGKITPEYHSWNSMIDRCFNTKSQDYKNYGGRGIRVCESWLESIMNFIADVGPRPSPKHSIDRIDVNGNYEPSNCRWATQTQQRANQRRRISNYEFDKLKEQLARYEEKYGRLPSLENC